MTKPCFLFLLFILFSSSAVSTYDSERDFSLCDSFGYKCGNQIFDIYYPFRLDTSPYYCGHHEFELSCTSENKPLVAHIGSKEYKVNYINYTHHLLSVTDMSFVDYVGGQSCDSIFTNTSINLSPFSYTSNDDNLMILMNCSSDPSLLYHNIRNITCTARDSHSTAYYNYSSDVEDDVRKKCNFVAIVPIYQSFVVNLKNSIMVDFMWVLFEGFELNWRLDDLLCNKCMDSSGTCYTNEMGSLACYCSGGTVSNDGNCVKNKLDCAPANCGNVRNITFPFWVEGQQPSYCGFLSFRLTCVNQSLILANSVVLSLQVKNIFYGNRSILVVDETFTRLTCGFRHWSLSFNLTLFNISGANKELVFLYNCTKPPSDDYYKVNCTSGIDTTYAVWDTDPRYHDTCRRAYFPVAGYMADNIRDYLRAVNYGFLLSWPATDCELCKNSTGQCGYNETYAGFMCICPDGTTHHATCHPSECFISFSPNTIQRETILMFRINFSW